MTPLRSRRGAARVAPALAAGLAALTAAAGCNKDRIFAPLETAATPSTLSANPTGALQLLATGIIAQQRASQGVWVRDAALFGREAFYFQLQDGRWTTGYFVNPNDNTAFGAGGVWGGRLANLRNIFNFRQALQANAATFQPTGVAGATGFAATEEALVVQNLVNSRFNFGTPVRVTEAVDDITPFVTRDSAYRFVSGTLDAGYTALTSSGARFPFTLPTGGTGFTGFTTPTTYATYNRALKARNEVYRGSLGCGAPCYQAALTALGQSFITATLTSGNLNTGVFYTASTATGDVTNAIWAIRNDFYANPSIFSDPTVPAGDTRLAKISSGAPSRSQAGSDASTFRFARYPTNDTPLTVIDNEELWLIRAEALWFTGDRAGATAALNAVASVAGGATGARYAQAADNDGFVTQLLAERRLSLLLEGHRWVDVRRFGRLNTLPLGGTNFVRAEQQVVPQGECQARDRIAAATNRPELLGPGCPVPPPPTAR